MADLLAKFRISFPEFAAVENDAVLRYIGDALAIHTGSNRATLYLTAHCIALDADSGAGDTGAAVDGGDGEVTSEGIAREKVSLKTQADKGADVFFTSTAYGRKFLVFRNAAPTRTFSVRVFG